MEKLWTASEIKAKLPDINPPINCAMVMTIFNTIEISKFLPVIVG